MVCVPGRLHVSPLLGVEIERPGQARAAAARAAIERSAGDEKAVGVLDVRQAVIRVAGAGGAVRVRVATIVPVQRGIGDAAPRQGRDVEDVHLVAVVVVVTATPDHEPIALGIEQRAVPGVDDGVKAVALNARKLGPDQRRRPRAWCSGWRASCWPAYRPACSPEPKPKAARPGIPTATAEQSAGTFGPPFSVPPLSPDRSAPRHDRGAELFHIRQFRRCRLANSARPRTGRHRP